MPTQNVSFDNATTRNVTFNNNEVCYVNFNGTEIWRKNPQASDLQTGNFTPRSYYNYLNGYGREGYIGRTFPVGIGDGSVNTYIQTSDQPGVPYATGQSRGLIQIFNRGRGFTSGSQVTGFLNAGAGTHTWNRSVLGHTFVWKNCTLNSEGGIQNINIGDAYSSGIGSRTWGRMGGNSNTSFSNGNYGDYEDDDDEPNHVGSIILGNRGTILVPYHRFTWGTSSANVVSNSNAIWRYFGGYGNRLEQQGRTKTNLPSNAWSDETAYVPVVSAFGSQHSSRSDVTSFGGMLLKDFVNKSGEFTGYACGESFAKLRFLGSEGGGSAD
jgi:hypothetical protein